MRIEEFATYIRKAALQVDDVAARKEIVPELREHLMESYEGERKTGMSHEAAVSEVLHRFGEAEGIGADLDRIHTPRLGARPLLVILSVVLLFVAIVYTYFHFAPRVTP